MPPVHKTLLISDNASKQKSKARQAPTNFKIDHPFPLLSIIPISIDRPVLPCHLAIAAEWQGGPFRGRWHVAEFASVSVPGAPRCISGVNGSQFALSAGLLHHRLLFWARAGLHIQGRGDALPIHTKRQDFKRGISCATFMVFGCQSFRTAS
ncbi:hypothetical protein HNY73_004543 [Argiope bruennichi]|uniref:Uncharacterized protein n=1 Tax=Argiope bruennichi TaxID=94029 RepID=A0A8T0FPA8_ARGBR|nr:hypothetical protein HNY73_004543 [Argiope bruennichi]